MVRPGDPLILRTPLGEIIKTTVCDFEMISYRPGATRLEASPLLLPSKFHKFDIPIGTEVFLGVTHQDEPRGEQDGGGCSAAPRPSA